MARRSEIVAVYSAGLVQGVALVTFPAASSILTSPDYYGLTSTAYGGLFLPQAIAAISAALAGSRLTTQLGVKRMFVAGLVGDLAAMSLLVASQFFIGDGALPYAMLLLATTSLGIGFGLTVPAINTFAAAFFPAAADRAVLYLNALLGLGTALAPVLVAVFLGLGLWWGLPVVVAVLHRGADRLQPGPAAARRGLDRRRGRERAGGPALAVLGLRRLRPALRDRRDDERQLGNAVHDQRLGASTTQASIALTTFWAMVTVGRILFAAIERTFPATNAYRLLPFVAAVAMGLLAILPSGAPTSAILVFGLAGLGCSALLPLTISFGQRELVAVGASLAGLLIAFYQMGYGLAAFGIGPLEEHVGLSLTAIYGAVAIVALAMGLLSFVVVRNRSPAT